MHSFWLRLTSGTLVTVKGRDVRVRGVLAPKARRIEDALSSFLPCEGHVAITGGRIKVYGELRSVEQRVRNSVLAHLG
jgi:hypothetical protein